MAGRGTDIKLGGNLEMRLKEALADVEDEAKRAEITKRIEKEIEEGHKKVVEAGGLYVIGTERHENRRIDNQLRGRSGRQGDPGRSIFFVSLEDDLMRIFGAERLKGILKTFRIPEGERISHPWITKAIRKAQQKVEQFHFDARKNLLKYDDVMNDQRKVIFNQRKELMKAESVHDMLQDIRHEIIENTIHYFMPEKTNSSEWDLNGLREELARLLCIALPIEEWIKMAEESSSASADKLIEGVIKVSDNFMDEKFKGFDEATIRSVEKSLLLQTIDQMWKEHLQALDILKRGIGLRAYGQRDPLTEYKRESFALFEAMLSRIHEQATILSSRVQLVLPSEEKEPIKTPEGEDIDFSSVGRNDPCPCGSGKKFKHCHGKIE